MANLIERHAQKIVGVRAHDYLAEATVDSRAPAKGVRRRRALARILRRWACELAGPGGGQQSNVILVGLKAARGATFPREESAETRETPAADGVAARRAGDEREEANEPNEGAGARSGAVLRPRGAGLVRTACKTVTRREAHVPRSVDRATRTKRHKTTRDGEPSGVFERIERPISAICAHARHGSCQVETRMLASHITMS